MYFWDLEDFQSLEIGVFLRFFLLGGNTVSGPFVQANAGAIVFARYEAVTLPADVGVFSAFLTAGWRFPLGSRFFIEPTIRAGTPYYIGAGVSGGIRF